MAVIIFGAWGVLKTVFNTVLRWDYYLGIPRTDSKILQDLFMIALIAILAIATLIEMRIRIYIGRSAIRESRGEKGRNGYLVLSVLLIFFYLFVFAGLMFPSSEGGEASMSREIMYVVMDVTSMFVSIAMIVSAIKVRRLSRQIAEAEEAEKAGSEAAETGEAQEAEEQEET